MRAIYGLVLSTTLLAACGPQQQNVSDVAIVNTLAPPDIMAPPLEQASATPVAARASRVEDKTDDFTFTYSYPAQAAAIAPLAAWLDADRQTARAGVAKDSAGFRREATKDGFPFRQYESTTQWSVVTDTPRFLSLSAETYDYTGGAHGSPGFRAVAWDKQAGARVEPAAVFESEAALERVLAAPMCKAVDVERTKRRGVPIVRGDDSFNACPKVSEGTLILGSTNRQAIDRIGLLIGPYVAGPYAEGTYEVTLPVTPALLAIVKPDYRAAFAVR